MADKTWKQECTFDFHHVEEPGTGPQSAPASFMLLSRQVSPQQDPEGHVLAPPGAACTHASPSVRQAWVSALSLHGTRAPSAAVMLPGGGKSITSQSSRQACLSVALICRTLNIGSCLGLWNYPKNSVASDR